MRLDLRPGTDDDEFLFALHRAAVGPVIEETWGPWDDQVQRELHAIWFAEPGRLSVVTLDGTPVGVVDVREEADGVLCLARMELLPVVQGRGLGSALLDQLCERARHAGAPVIELDVLEHGRSPYDRWRPLPPLGAGEDITAALDLQDARRLGLEQRRVNVDFPSWMVEALDREAKRLGVTRQSVMKMWIADRLEQRPPSAA